MTQSRIRITYSAIFVTNEWNRQPSCRRNKLLRILRTRYERDRNIHVLKLRFRSHFVVVSSIIIFIAVNNNNVEMTNVIVGVGVHASGNRIRNTLLHSF